MKLIDISTPKFPNTFAMVDDEGFDFLNQWKWCAVSGRGTIYVSRSVWGLHKNTYIQMHRVVMNAKANQPVDHIDGNGMNNTKANLRFYSGSQNHHNMRRLKKETSSRFKGVSFDKEIGKFGVRICVHGKRIHLGYFKNENDAGLAYNKAASEHFGEFARLNNVNFKEEQ